MNITIEELKDRNTQIYIFYKRDLRHQAQKLFLQFIRCGICMKGFVSDDKGDKDLFLYNKRIVNLADMDCDICVVTGSKHYSERYNIYYINEKNLLEYEDQKGVNPTIEMIEKWGGVNSIWTMNRLMNGKKIFIYGLNDTAKQLAIYLRFLDLSFCGFVWDREYSVEKSSECIYPEELLYEEKFFVIIESDNPQKCINKLLELGLEHVQDFSLSQPFNDTLADYRKTVLDVNLGQSYKSKNGYAGFTVHGEGDGLKIAVLGGSTTDGMLYPYKSWAEFLYEKLMGDYDVTVYNGGINGYSSSQELVKLIRDVLYLNPDIIIVYDGFNDGRRLAGGRFAFDELNRIFHYVANHLDERWYAEGWGIEQPDDTNITYGLELDNCEKRFDGWLSNHQLMHVISKSRGIKYYGFLQPMLSSKKTRTKEEESILISSHQYLRPDFDENFRTEMQERSIESKYGYLYDLSHIFDQYTGIYNDVCHVKEKGNEIIAEEILKRIM
ncbi:MAG: hypothetical protein K1W41_20670 [Lachnospiraceae bacterium]